MYILSLINTYNIYAINLNLIYKIYTIIRNHKINFNISIYTQIYYTTQKVNYYIVIIPIY